MEDKTSDELGQLSAQIDKTHGMIEIPPHIAASILRSEADRLAKQQTADSSGMIEYGVMPIVGNVVNDNSEKLSPTKLIPLDPKRYDDVVVKGELQPFGNREIYMKKDGRTIIGDIVASVSIGDGGMRCEVVRDQDGAYGMFVIDADGRVQRVEKVGPYSTVRIGKGEFRTNYFKNKDGEEWSIGYHSDSGETDEPLAVDLEIGESVETKYKSDIDKAEKHKKRFKWLRRLVGASAIYATLAPGGLSDMAMDPFVDAGDVVNEAVDSYKPTSADFYNLDSIVDGISVRGLDDPQEFINQMNGEIQEDWEKTQAAGEAVEQTMNDLDNHDYQAILDRAEDYRELHSDEFISDDIVAEVLDNLDAAQTKDEALVALKPFGEFYGYSFFASDDVSLDAVKYTAKEVVKSLENFPTGLTQKAVLKEIHFKTSDEVNYNHRGSFVDRVGAYYSSGNEGSIHIGSKDQVGANLEKLIRVPGADGGGFDMQSLFLHEFGHALDAGNTVSAVADYDRLGGGLDSPLNLAEDFIMGGILQSPQVISTYSRTDEGESIAENTSGILSDRSDGLAHPDEARKFISPANQTMIAGLIQFEKSDPGLANYLIAQNDRLMHGQTLSAEQSR